MGITKAFRILLTERMEFELELLVAEKLQTALYQLAHAREEGESLERPTMELNMARCLYLAITSKEVTI